ncbi:MAG: putative aminohydrolase SsnA [Sphaerochaetaceae bacterium]|nr:putative aminohydrolase SsnA [Sphaerochaetaceae bacterium]
MVTVIRNTRVIQMMEPVEVLEGVDVVIEDDKIKAVGKNAAAEVKADKTIEGDGKTVIPGMVCGHHHYYSGLSRAMLISAGPQTDLIQILKEWWWRLDRALDEESLYYSSLICTLDAIKNGTTTCIDHHESPNYIGGSLSTLSKGMEQFGLRGIVAYGITDRNYGMKEIRDGVQEGIRFAKEVDARKARGENVLVEAMVGGHAPFTIPEEGMELLADSAKQTGRGMHLHVAEGEYDSVWSHHFYNMDIMDRLDKHGLLSDKTLLVHGIYLNEHEIDLLNERGCFFAHNPRSNMNNQVGYSKYLPRIRNLIMGTDGCGSNMFEECKIAFFKNRDANGPFWPGDYMRALTNANRFLEKYFVGDRFGRVESGYKADLTILSYQNPTPLVKENAAGHFIWGMSSNSVESVLINGKLVMENRQFDFDEKEIYAKAAECAKRLWNRTDGLSATGTSGIVR